jgi:hypothetical protein
VSFIGRRNLAATVRHGNLADKTKAFTWNSADEVLNVTAIADFLPYVSEALSMIATATLRLHGITTTAAQRSASVRSGCALPWSRRFSICSSSCSPIKPGGDESETVAWHNSDAKTHRENGILFFPLPAARGEVGLPTGPTRSGRPDDKLRNPGEGACPRV